MACLKSIYYSRYNLVFFCRRGLRCNGYAEEHEKCNTENCNTIHEYNSLDSCYEFVNKNINEDNKDILNKFNWKNIIENPDSLLINTLNIPASIIDKVNDKLHKMDNKYSPNFQQSSLL